MHKYADSVHEIQYIFEYHSVKKQKQKKTKNCNALLCSEDQSFVFSRQW